MKLVEGTEWLIQSKDGKVTLTFSDYQEMIKVVKNYNNQNREHNCYQRETNKIQLIPEPRGE